MGEVVKLVTNASDEVLKEDARQVLQEAMDMGLHSVIVFGLDSNGKICTQNSRNRNCLEVIGALEAAKIHLWKLP